MEKLDVMNNTAKLCDRDKHQLDEAWARIGSTGDWMLKEIDKGPRATNTREFDMMHRLRHSLRDLYTMVGVLIKRGHTVYAPEKIPAAIKEIREGLPVLDLTGPAHVRKGPAGPLLLIGHIPVRSWLGTMHNDDADILAQQINNQLLDFDRVTKGIEEAIHYPSCWDIAAYPTLASALVEVYASFKCSNEDTHPVPCCGGSGGVGD